MTDYASLCLIPYVIAFLLFVFRFYNRERVSSIFSLTFVLAILTVLAAFSYLLLGVLDSLPAHSALIYGAIGLILLATAIGRLFIL